MTLEELEAEFYEDLEGRITAVRLIDDASQIDFECNHWREESRIAASIICHGVVESTVTAGDIGLIERPADHPLLWEYNEAHANLYFSSAPPNPFELLGRLYTVHEKLFKGWRLPSAYIHASADVLSGGHGQLAHGPVRAITAYKDVVEPLVQYSVVSTYTPKENRQLVLFDDSFIIC
jgi:hypothetical protein